MLQWDMAKETGYLWRCEYANCRHVWIAHTETPPRRCAKCKKCNWHKTITLQEAIRLSNWREQMIEEAKPYISQQIKMGIAQAILDAKKRPNEYVAEAIPAAVANLKAPGLCGQRQADYEAGVWGSCGKLAGHKASCGAWIPQEAIDP